MAFYICPTCFEASSKPRICHQHWMVRCYAGKPGSFRRKPLSDRFGHYVSRAPFWFIEATGQHPTWTSFQPDKSTPVAVDPHEEDLS